MPDGPAGRAGDDVPGTAVVGRLVRSRPGPGSRLRHRVDDGVTGGAPGPRTGAGRRPRRPMGPGRRVHLRGPIPRRVDRYVVCPRARGRRDRCHPEAFRRVLSFARRAQPRPDACGAARAGGRPPDPVRDGCPRRARSIRHALVRRGRRAARSRGSGAPDRHPARPVGLRRGRGRRTTSASPSWPRFTASPPISARPRHRRSMPASMSSCRPATRTERHWPTPFAAGKVDEALVDRALERVLRQKAELGLLDVRYDGPPPAVGGLDLGGTPGHRQAARQGGDHPARERRDPPAGGRHARSR